MNQAIADPVPVTLSNGQSWGRGPTFNLLWGPTCCGTSGALTATFQNLHDTILIESAPKNQTYTQLKTGAAITADPTR